MRLQPVPNLVSGNGRRLFEVLAAVLLGAAAAFWLDAPVWRLAAAAGAVGWLAAWRFAALSRRRMTRLLWLLALTSTIAATGLDLWRFSTTPWVRVWNVYHYYIGAKYFAELGFRDLYAATLRADSEGDDYWRQVRRVRNLATYAIEPRSAEAGRYRPEEHFTAERWRDFQRDLSHLQRHREPRRWRGIFVDRGYNPSPLWTVVGHGLTALFPAHRLAALKTLCGLDLVLMAATFWGVARVFGSRAAAWALLFFVLTPVNEGRLVGGFLQYDWFCALAGGLCFLRRGLSLPAGALVAYAAMTRVFPLLLVFSAMVPLVAFWIRSGGFRRRQLAFFLSFGLFCGLGFGVGCLSGSGVRAWTDFAGNLRHHSDEHVFGERRVGLKRAFTHDVTHLALDASRSSRRRELFARQHGLYQVAAAVFLLAWLVACARRSVPDALLLGLVPFFALAVSSRYYWSYLALLPLLARPGPAGRRRLGWLALGQTVLYGLYSLHELSRPGPYAAYSLFNLFLGVFLLGMTALYAARDRRAFRRLSGTLTR